MTTIPPQESLPPTSDAGAPTSPDELGGVPANWTGTSAGVEATHHPNWFNVAAPAPEALAGFDAWRPRRGRWSVALERVALAAERLVNRVTSAHYNPLYHTGTLAFLLLLIVGFTGVYLFLFFQYGYDASYDAVARMESQFIARTIRAIHRYASGAVVIVTLLHAYRTLFLEKFRGPRWLAWVTGIAMTLVLWLAGVTGYWLIWDERALLITDTFRGALEALTSWTPAFMVYLTGAGERGASWVFFLLILAAHVVLFLVAIGSFYLHIVRLRRPKWLPPLHWVVGVGVVLLVGALVFPAGMLAQADLGRLPAAISFDPIFLFFLPFPGACWLWAGLLVVTAATAALPWLSRRVRARPDEQPTRFPPAHTAGPRVRILPERCTGCTRCALDCPYGALEMVERDDGRPHKYVAVEHLDRCVGCGICVGSCDVAAVGLVGRAGERGGRGAAEIERIPLATAIVGGADSLPRESTPEALWGLVAARLGTGGARVVFTCERHAAHGARPFLSGERQAEEATVYIALPCIGTAPADLIGRTLDAGARSVRLIGCPPDDCANREGNLWESHRLLRERMPRLRRPYIDAPITAAWVPPDAFAVGLQQAIPPADDGAPDYPTTRRLGRDFSWRSFAPAVALLGLVLLVQVLLTDLPLRVNAGRPATVQLVTADIGATFGRLTAGQVSDDAYLLQLWIDGEEKFRRSFEAAEIAGAAVEDRLPFFHEVTLTPGTYDVFLQLTGEQTGIRHILHDSPLSLGEGEIAYPSLRIDAPVPCRPSDLPARAQPCAQ